MRKKKAKAETESLESRQRDLEVARVATPETIRKFKRRGPSTIDTLFRQGALRHHHLDAADEIRQGFETVTRMVSCKTTKAASIEGYGAFFDMFPAHSHAEMWTAHALHLKARLAAWHEALKQRGIGPLGWLCYRVVVDGQSLRQIGREIGHSSGKDIGLLRSGLTDALDVYAECAGFAPQKQVDN